MNEGVSINSRSELSTHATTEKSSNEERGKIKKSPRMKMRQRESLYLVAKMMLRVKSYKLERNPSNLVLQTTKTQVALGWKQGKLHGRYRLFQRRTPDMLEARGELALQMRSLFFLNEFGRAHNHQKHRSWPAEAIGPSYVSWRHLNPRSVMKWGRNFATDRVSMLSLS